MKKIFCAVLTFGLFSCSSVKKLDTDEYLVLLSGQYGGSEKFSKAIIDNNNDLANEISNLPIDEADYSKFLNIDFKTKNVLLLHLGQKNTGGYSISIAKIEQKGELLTVYYKINSPKPGENVTMALTNPFIMVELPKTKEVEVKE